MIFNTLKEYNDFHHSILYIYLGAGCNFQCKYCIEGQTHRYEKKEINPKIYPFIEEFEGVITFYGGEPFLYFDQMQEIVSQCSNKKHFASMTNGTLIQKNELFFINNKHISINVSWDGPNTKKTRFRDVIEENWNNLVQINDLWISTVINKYNYPKDFLSSMCILDSYYYKLHKYHMRCFLEPIIKSYEDSFFDMDLERLRWEITDILKSPSNFYEAFFGL